MSKIENTIKSELDSRMECMVITYILDKGYDHVKKITEEQIMEIEGNGLMTKEFVQSLVRTATKICKENSIMDIVRFIREDCWFDNVPQKQTIYENEVDESLWEELTGQFEEENGCLEIMMFQKVEE